MVLTAIRYVHTSSFDQPYPRKLATLALERDFEMLLPERARINSLDAICIYVI